MYTERLRVAFAWAKTTIAGTSWPFEVAALPACTCFEYALSILHALISTWWLSDANLPDFQVQVRATEGSLVWGPKRELSWIGFPFKPHDLTGEKRYQTHLNYVHYQVVLDANSLQARSKPEVVPRAEGEETSREGEGTALA